MRKYITQKPENKATISGAASSSVAPERKEAAMESVAFHVPGKPQGKARAKTVRNKYTGNTMSYTPEKDLLY